MCTLSFSVEMNVQLVCESWFSMKQIQKQVVSLKSSELYLSINVKYVRLSDSLKQWVRACENDDYILHSFLR